jgi:hypothetical protein
VTEQPLPGSSAPQTLSAAAQPPAGSESDQQDAQQPAPAAKEPPPQPAVGGKEANPPAVKKVELGKNVFIEIEGDKRRVVVQSYVCLRQGGLEQLLTTENGKKHESILAADMDARMIHTALLACEAKPGHPIRFQPKLEPPAGAVIKITLEYKNKDNKVVRVPAQQWIKNSKTKKDLAQDWVFAGSVLISDPLDKKAPPFYGANSGDVICVANMDTALLDLPIESNSEGDLSFEANTERIPAENTPVLIILEPVPEKKNQK